VFAPRWSLKPATNGHHDWGKHICDCCCRLSGSASRRGSPNLSGGKLVARAHCVATMAADVSRETMAVFLQPSWERPLMLPMWGAETALQAGGLSTDLETMIPPLTSRWRQGSTFCGIFTGNNTAVLWCGGTSIKKRTDLRSTPWWKN